MSDLIDQLERAFDYRGDVSLDLTDERTLVGYLSNRGPGSRPALADGYCELLPTDGGPAIRLAYTQIRAVRFTGKDHFEPFPQSDG